MIYPGVRASGRWLLRRGVSIEELGGAALRAGGVWGKPVPSRATISFGDIIVSSPATPTGSVTTRGGPRPATPPGHHPWLRARDQCVLAAVAAWGWLWLVPWCVERTHRPWSRHAEAVPEAPRFVVDINTAAWPELAVLPGIGAVLAQRIVETRVQRGGFRHPSELAAVRGIGPKKLAAVEPLLAPIALEPQPQP